MNPPLATSRIALTLSESKTLRRAMYRVALRAVKQAVELRLGASSTKLLMDLSLVSRPLSREKVFLHAFHYKPRPAKVSSLRFRP